MSELFVFGIGGNVTYSWSVGEECVRIIFYERDPDDGPEGHPVGQCLLDEGTLKVMLAGLQWEIEASDKRGGTAG